MSIFSNLASSTPADIAAYIAGLLHLLGDHDPVIILRESPAALQRFLDTVPTQIVASPEAPGKWSIREVVQHLADSELVGGFRLRMILAHDRPPLAGYDQDLWARRLRYRDVEVRDAFEQFSAIRRANVRIWERLNPTDLARAGIHGERGEESLEHLRRLYAAHDLLHLQQLERIRSALLSNREHR
jgi:hypothetical protein